MADRLPELLILGLGGQARVVASIVAAQGYRVKGLLDALGEPQSGSRLFGLPVLGGVSLLKEMETPAVAIAIGDNYLRRDVMQKISQVNPTVKIVSLIHPQSYREKDVRIGSHVTICIGAIVCTAVEISDGAIVNSGAIIEHECVLGQYSHVCPGVRLGGRVRVGEFTQIGIGASVINKVAIGSHAVIGAGSVVIDNIPDNVTAVGVPAKVIKRGEIAAPTTS